MKLVEIIDNVQISKSLANIKVRQAMKEKNVPQWLLADALGRCENTVQRMLRKELPEEEQNRLVEIISSISR